MATKETQKARKIRSKNSCFPSCFGFGGRVSDPSTKKSSRDMRSGKKKSPWFWWSSFRLTKSGIKTVPVDAAVVEKLTREVDVVAQIQQELKRVPKKMAGKHQIQGNPERKFGRDPGEVGTVSDRGVLDKSRKILKFSTKSESGKLQRTESHTQILAVEFRSPSDPSMAAKDDTSLNTGSLAKNSRSRYSSPETKPSRSLTTSSSFPPPDRRKSIQTAVISRLSGRKNDPLTGKLNPTFGMSILMVMLAILLLWGRICAVVFASACFYFFPRLITAVNSAEVGGNGPGRGNPDVNSSEYKKKVVLEGLLERNH